MLDGNHENVNRGGKKTSSSIWCSHNVNKQYNICSLVQQFSGVSVIRAYVVKIFDEVIGLEIWRYHQSAVNTIVNNESKSLGVQWPQSCASIRFNSKCDNSIFGRLMSINNMFHFGSDFHFEQMHQFWKIWSGRRWLPRLPSPTQDVIYGVSFSIRQIKVGDKTNPDWQISQRWWQLRWCWKTKFWNAWF